METGKAYALNLQFKGSRKYLHGTDIIKHVVGLSGASKNISVNIHKMTSHELSARIVDQDTLAKLKKSGELAAVFYHQKPDEELEAISIVEGNKNVTKSYAYDEDIVTRGAIIDDRSIAMQTAKSGNIFERTVALHKSLLSSVEGHHDWLFSSISLAMIPDNDVALRITLKNTIAGKVYKSMVEADGVEIGSIVFAKRPSA